MKTLMDRFMNTLKDLSTDAKKKFNCNIINEREYKHWESMWLNQANKLIEDEKEKLKEYKEQDNQARVLQSEKTLQELIKEREQHMQLLTDL